MSTRLFDPEMGPGVRTVRPGSPEDATEEVLAALRLDTSLTAAWDEAIAGLRATLGDERTAALLARATTTLSAGPAPAPPQPHRLRRTRGDSLMRPVSFAIVLSRMAHDLGRPDYINRDCHGFNGMAAWFASETNPNPYSPDGISIVGEEPDDPHSCVTIEASVGRKSWSRHIRSLRSIAPSLADARRWLAQHGHPLIVDQPKEHQ